MHHAPRRDQGYATVAALLAAPAAAAALAAGFVAGAGGPGQAPHNIAATLIPNPAANTNTTSQAPPAGGGAPFTITFPETRTIGVELTPDTAAERGIATTFTATFTQPIPVHAQNQVEDAFTFESDKPLPAGAWVWTAPDTMVWRGETFLPAHTTITLKADAAPGEGSLYSDAGVVYVTDGTPQTVTRIGRDSTTVVDTGSHTATITVDGQEQRTVGISGGKPGYETLAGVKVTGEKYEVLRMTSASAGVAEFYDLMVPYSVRLTDHGEFIHAAPWNPQIGQANTSHGCTNMTVDDARWYYEQSIPGDPVITQGPGLPPMSKADSAGGVWNYTWDEWVAAADS